MSPDEYRELVRATRPHALAWGALGLIAMLALCYLGVIDNPEPAMPDCPTDRQAVAIQCAPAKRDIEIGTPATATIPHPTPSTHDDTPVVCTVDGFEMRTNAYSAKQLGLTDCEIG